MNAGITVSRLRYIGYTSDAKETKNFVEDFIERLKLVGNTSEEEMDKLASKKGQEVVKAYYSRANNKAHDTIKEKL